MKPAGHCLLMAALKDNKHHYNEVDFHCVPNTYAVVLS